MAGTGSWSPAEKNRCAKCVERGLEIDERDPLVYRQALDLEKAGECEASMASFR